MFDIKFYQKIYNFKQEILSNSKLYTKDEINTIFDTFISQYPTIYNIETTNVCNMTCSMCPRTTLMNREIGTMDIELFKRIIDQIDPWSTEDIEQWTNFVIKNYKVLPTDMSENHFFLYVISTALTLHGYGDPLLDKTISEKIKLLTERNIPSYFSCNPSNINIDKLKEIMSNGLTYLKFSIDSINEDRSKNIRGNQI